MILPSGLQYTLKRVGPKTDPCGTPYLTRLQQERELFTFSLQDIVFWDEYLTILNLPMHANTVSVCDINSVFGDL